MTKVFRVSFFALFVCSGFALAQTTPHVPATEPVQETPVTEVPAVEAVPAVEPVPEAPPAVAESAAPVAEPVAAVPVAAPAPEAPAVVKEPLKIKFAMGLRLGFGISDFRSHKALAFGEQALATGINWSYSLGAVFSFGFNSLFSLSPELQYTYYSASNEFTKDRGVADFEDMHEIIVYMHSLELPILAHFNLGKFYAEVGPQIGYNHYAKIYKDNMPKKPDVNPFAFGAAFGGGININGMQLGIRGYFGILEYAENSDGYPWNVQASLTKFFF